MKRHLALLLAATFVILGIAAFPFVYYLNLLQRPSLVENRLDEELLYALAVPGVVIELEKERGIRSLDGTVLELDRSDLNFLLQTSFTPAELKAKSLEVHGSIVESIRGGPADAFTFPVSIKEEFPEFKQNLLRIFHRKMTHRPECSMGDFLKVAWRSVGKIFGAREPTPEEQLRKLPHCRPPKMVQKSVLKAVSARMEQAQANSPDSIVVRPAFGPKAHRLVRRGLALGQTGPAWAMIFPGLLLGIVLLSWGNWPATWARLAAPLLITGLLLLLVNLPIFFYWQHLDLFSIIQKVDPDFVMSESTGQWLQVVFYLAREGMQVASYHLMLLAGFLVLGGLVLVRQNQLARRARAKIDMDSSRELGSARAAAVPPGLQQEESHAAPRPVL